MPFSLDEILVYLRKSRSDDPLLSVEEVLARHEKILDEWVERYIGGAVPEHNKFREVVSGETIQARPEIQKVLRMVEQPKYKAILTVEVQRLSRGDLEDAGRLIKLLRYTNTFVITPQKIYNLNDEYDRDLFERELKRGNEYLEYTKKIMLRGRLESVKEGNYIGSIAPYGYDKDFIIEGKKKVPTLKINEPEAEVVRMIFDLYANQNLGVILIAHRLNALGKRTRIGELWTQSSILFILANEHYIGKVKWNFRKSINVVEEGKIREKRPRSTDYYLFNGKHPAIIDNELFEKARAKQGKNPKVRADRPLRNALSGLIFCHCGKAMTLRTYKNKHGKERCEARLLCNNQVYCRTSSVLYDEVLERVIDVLNNCIADFEVQIKNDNKDALENHANLIKKLELKLEELKKKELNQWEKYTEESMPKQIFNKLNEKVLQEQETVKQALENAKSTAPIVEDYQEKIMRFTDAVQALKNPDVSADSKNRLLKACIERIEYKRDKKGTRWYATPFELDITLKV